MHGARLVRDRVCDLLDQCIVKGCTQGDCLGEYGIGTGTNDPVQSLVTVVVFRNPQAIVCRRGFDQNGQLFLEGHTGHQILHAFLDGAGRILVFGCAHI